MEQTTKKALEEWRDEYMKTTGMTYSDEMWRKNTLRRINDILSVYDSSDGKVIDDEVVEQDT